MLTLGRVQSHSTCSRDKSLSEEPKSDMIQVDRQPAPQNTRGALSLQTGLWSGGEISAEMSTAGLYVNLQQSLKIH